jgi:hypothetical protein
MKLKDFALRTEGTGTRAPTDGERTGGKEGGRVDDGQDSRAVGHQRERDVECLLGADQVDRHRPEDNHHVGAGPGASSRPARREGERSPAAQRRRPTAAVP